MVNTRGAPRLHITGALVPVNAVVFIALFFATAAGAITTSASLTVDVNAPLNPVNPLLFGVNANDDNNGAKMVYGEQLTDRSFRSLDPPYNLTAVWHCYRAGVSSGTGECIRSPTGGHDQADGSSSFSYNGYMTLSTTPGSSGSVALTQSLGNDALTTLPRAGVRMTIRVSLRNSGANANVAFVWQLSSLPSFPTLASNSTGAITSSWQRFEWEFTVAQNVLPTDITFLSLAAYVFGDASETRLDVDEVRMFPAGIDYLSVDPAAQAIFAPLGVTNSRWPGGGVSTFSWIASVNPLPLRGEHQIGYSFQTVSFGLNEWLRWCEQTGQLAMIDINPLDTPASNQALIEYINSDQSTTMGQLRAAHGHTAPYQLQYVELGNEPDGLYRGALSVDDAGENYISLALAHGTAIRAAQGLSRPVQLGVITSPQFSLVPSASFEPFWRDWNSQAFNPVASPNLLGFGNFTNAHFYSFVDGTAVTGLQAPFAAGSVLLASKQVVDSVDGQLPMFITEFHHIFIRQFVPELEFVKDTATFRGGLVLADMLLAMMQSQQFMGAQMFKLSTEYDAPWGLFVPVQDQPGPFRWVMRPSGLAFGMLSEFQGETIATTTVSAGQPTITIPTQNQIIPAGFTFNQLSVLATVVAGQGSDPALPRVVLLNRDVARDIEVTITIENGATNANFSYQYAVVGYHAWSLTDMNDFVFTNVTLSHSSLTVGRTFTFLVPARSMYRLDPVGVEPNGGGTSGGAFQSASFASASMVMLVAIMLVRTPEMCQ